MIFVGLALATLPAPQTQAKSARWEMTADPTACYLRSINGEVDRQSLLFEAKPLAEGVDMILIGAPRLPIRDDTAVINAGSLSAPLTAPFHPTSTSGLFKSSVWMTWSALQQLETASDASIKVGDSQAATVSLTGLGRGIAALKQCTSAILNKMGYRPGEATPVPTGGWEKRSTEWIRDSDYPRQALDQGTGGKTLLGWIIGTDGRIKNCTPLVPSSNSILDTAACNALTKRAQYTPKTDKDGKPVEGFAARWIVFRP